MNRKYNLEMNAGDPDSASNAPNNFSINRRNNANLVIKDDEEGKAADATGMTAKTPGLIFSTRPLIPAATLGSLSDYATTGIYIDPNQITKKHKPKKKSGLGGRDIKYALKDLEVASFIGMDDFMGGGLGSGSGSGKR